MGRALRYLVSLKYHSNLDKTKLQPVTSLPSNCEYLQKSPNVFPDRSKQATSSLLQTLSSLPPLWGSWWLWGPRAWLAALRVKLRSDFQVWGTQASGETFHSSYDEPQSRQGVEPVATVPSLPVLRGPCQIPRGSWDSGYSGGWRAPWK